MEVEEGTGHEHELDHSLEAALEQAMEDEALEILAGFEEVEAASGSGGPEDLPPPLAPEPRDWIKVVVPEGDITWYKKRNDFYAHCKCGHEPCCRPRTSMEPVNKLHSPGQGRPLGALLAWLRLGSGSSRDEHKFFTFPTLEQRQAARNFMLSDARFAPLLQQERKQYPGEPEEPPYFD